MTTMCTHSLSQVMDLAFVNVNGHNSVERVPDLYAGKEDSMPFPKWPLSVDKLRVESRLGN